MQSHTLYSVSLPMGVSPSFRPTARIGQQPFAPTPSIVDDTIRQQQAEDVTTVLKQALQRPKPVAELGTSDSLSYQTPMLDFVARDYTPQVEYTASPPKPSTGWVWLASIAGAISVLGGLFSLGAALVSSRNSTNSAMNVLLGGILSVGGVMLPWNVYQRYKQQQKDYLKNPSQPILRNVPNPQQNWINRSMVQMMDLTNIHATLGEGNKALKANTGDTFTKRLAHRESRLLAEETQALQEIHNREMEAKANEAIEAANEAAEYTAQVANQTNPYYPFNFFG
jgi:hypothetical protein